MQIVCNHIYLLLFNIVSVLSMLFFIAVIHVVQKLKKFQAMPIPRFAQYQQNAGLNKLLSLKSLAKIFLFQYFNAPLFCGWMYMCVPMWTDFQQR